MSGLGLAAPEHGVGGVWVGQGRSQKTVETHFRGLSGK